MREECFDSPSSSLFFCNLYNDQRLLKKSKNEAIFILNDLFTPPTELIELKTTQAGWARMAENRRQCRSKDWAVVSEYTDRASTCEYRQVQDSSAAMAVPGRGCLQQAFYHQMLRGRSLFV